MGRFGRAVVIGAAGGFGRAFATLLVDDGVPVLGVDIASRPASASGDWLAADATQPSAALTAALEPADLVVIAVPEASAFGALDSVASRVGTNALVVDTMSVKAPVAQWAAAGRLRGGLLSINPLFAPDLGFGGRLVAAVGLRPGGDHLAFVALLEAAGAVVLPMTADEHDRDTAATQALTHTAVLAAALALSRHPDGPLPRTVTPPHRALVLLAARVLAGSPGVYWAIQHDNPHAGAARRLLADAVDDIDALVAAGNEAAFADLFTDLGGEAGANLAVLAADSSALLAALAVSGRERSDRPRS